MADDKIKEYGPKDIAEMLRPMKSLWCVGSKRLLISHNELADRIKSFLNVDSRDADFVIGFLNQTSYLWNIPIDGREKYVLSGKGRELLRRYL